ncbi:hypothetical protein LTR72_005743 [Exophiala xenobiotica]|nr:hypothetical protein LTR72_005743 [Exophiala xenobiotica]KAK5485907.1 hypothetical protein LTR55_005585 [Exophiala xenobiotica]
MPKQQLRSRGGCRECRRMHRKCSEQRPSCEYCSSTGKQCSYDKVLKWGGRSFKKSCFGQVLSTGAVVKQSEKRSGSNAPYQQPFVYGPGADDNGTSTTTLPTTGPAHISGLPTWTGASYSKPPSSNGDVSPDQAASSPSNATPDTESAYITSPSGLTVASNGPLNETILDVDDVSCDTTPDPAVVDSCQDLVLGVTQQDATSSVDLEVNLDWLPWLSKVDRSLLNHFTLTVTSYLSLHQTMQNDFCTVLLPMALDTSHGTHLLSAILGLAAIHQISLGSYNDEAYLAQLRYTSLQQLRLQSIGHSAALDEQSIATALTLCLCDILAGGEKPKSWRLHLQGAATMIRTYFSRHPPNSGNILVLWRWWKSLQSLSVLLGNPTPEVNTKSALTLEPPNQNHYIDTYDGFSTKLHPMIEEVDMLNAESQALQKLEATLGHDDPSVKVLRNAHSTRCATLIEKISAMMDDPVTELDPASSSATPFDPSSDYFSLNEAYHLAVMLQVYQRAMNLTVTDTRVQEVVKRGISCLRSITLYDFASPGVATLQPLFIFGCAAHEEEDRRFVMDWIERMRRTYSLRNTDSAREFLLELWQERDSMGSMGAQLQYHQLLAEKDWDLSLW